MGRLLAAQIFGNVFLHLGVKFADKWTTSQILKTISCICCSHLRLHIIWFQLMLSYLHNMTSNMSSPQPSVWCVLWRVSGSGACAADTCPHDCHVSRVTCHAVTAAARVGPIMSKCPYPRQPPPGPEWAVKCKEALAANEGYPKVRNHGEGPY